MKEQAWYRKITIAIAMQSLYNDAFSLLGGFHGRHQNSPDRLIKDVLKTLLGQSGAFEIPDSVDLLAALDALRVRYRGHALLLELLDVLDVIAKIQLGADKDDGDVWGMVGNFRVPLGEDVVKGWGANDGKADQEDVGLRVGEGAKTIVILLTSGIPQTETDGLVVHHHVRRVVVEDSGNVFSGKGIGGVTDQQAGLSDSSVAGNDALQGPGGGHIVFW